nr:hypothetical protein [Escherichia coli]
MHFVTHQLIIFERAPLAVSRWVMFMTKAWVCKSGSSALDVSWRKVATTRLLVFWVTDFPWRVVRACASFQLHAQQRQQLFMSLDNGFIAVYQRLHGYPFRR